MAGHPSRVEANGRHAELVAANEAFFAIYGIDISARP
jgi:hypothetical protein